MSDRADTCSACGTAFAADAVECANCGEPRIERTVMRNGLEIFEGKWAIDGKIGEGGMGTVYAATDLALDRKVAIKTLSRAICSDESMVQRFEREAKMMAKLDHPNLVPIHAVGRQGDVPFIVMKFLEGTNLSDHMRARGRLPLSEVVSIMKQVCAGLGFVHTRGVTHRDIKPANIFISPEGHVTILDLGVAHDPKTSTTRSGMMVGTPRYMAPEQIMGAKVDQRSDLYALGVVLFEMIAGKPPFDGESDFSVMKAHTDVAPPDPTDDSTLPKAIGAVTMRALAKKADERFQTAAELLAAFEAATRSVKDDPPAGRARIVKQRATPAPSQAAPRMARNPPSQAPVARPTTVDKPAPTPIPTSVQAAAFVQPTKTPMYAAGGVIVLLLAVGGYMLFGRSSGTPPTLVPPPPAYEVIGDGEAARPHVAEVKPLEPVKAAEPVKPTEPVKPPEPVKPAEPVAVKPPPPEPVKPAEPVKPPPKKNETAVATAQPVKPPPKPAPPPPAAPAPAATADAEVTVTVKVGGALSSAYLDVDGMRVGSTPKKLTLKPGKHTLHLERPDFKPIDKTIDVKAGEQLKLPLNLEKMTP